MHRRRVLGLFGGGGALGLAYYSFKNNVLDRGNRSGFTVPESYLNDDDFVNWLDRIYREGFSGFDDSMPNILVDVIIVENNRGNNSSIPDDVVDKVEEKHITKGINAMVQVRDGIYPFDDFTLNYMEMGPDNISPHVDKFVKSEIREEMNEAAIQVVILPTYGQIIQFPEEDDEWVGYNSSETNSIGISSTPAIKKDYQEDFEGALLRTFLHELGHAYGLDHSQDKKSIMYKKIHMGSRSDFSGEEWRKIWERIDSD
ncbi:hypothetical protein HTG_16850 [Natrinema mahii]|nr:hypothetical protein HTG_16850 [Natrinema mahii]